MTALDDRLAALKQAGRVVNIGGQGLGTIALERIAEAPDRVVAIDEARTVSRVEMMDAARRLGGALLARGVAPGAAIAFQGPSLLRVGGNG